MQKVKTILFHVITIIFISACSQEQQNSQPVSLVDNQNLTASAIKQPEKIQKFKSIQDNNKLKIKLVRQIYLAYGKDLSSHFDNGKYATPNLKKIMSQFDKISRQIDPDMACDMAKHFYFGFGQDVPDNFTKNLKIIALKDGLIQATFKDFDNMKTGAIIKLNCQNDICEIDDVKRLDDKSSLKSDYKKVIETKSCGFEDSSNQSNNMTDSLESNHDAVQQPIQSHSDKPKYYDVDCLCSNDSICIGPRGGHYCITSGGNKRYIKH